MSLARSNNEASTDLAMIRSGWTSFPGYATWLITKMDRLCSARFVRNTMKKQIEWYGHHFHASNFVKISSLSTSEASPIWMLCMLKGWQ